MQQLPLMKRVLAEMLPYFTEHFLGNASKNTHPLGWYAQGAIDKARQQVASFIGAELRKLFLPRAQLKL